MLYDALRHPDRPPHHGVEVDEDAVRSSSVVELVRAGPVALHQRLSAVTS